LNQKSFANIIFVVVIIVLICTFGYFTFVKKTEPTRSPHSQQVKDTINIDVFENNIKASGEIDDWQTFKSNSSNIEFKYPAGWSQQSEQDGGIFKYSEVSSPDLKIREEYQGGDVPALIGWEDGAKIDFKIWDLTKLAQWVKTDLEKCLSNNNGDISIWVAYGVGNSIKCSDEGISPEDLNFYTRISGARIIMVAGEKALMYAAQRDPFNFSEVYIRMFDKNNNNLLVDIKFSTFLPKKDINFGVLAKILSTFKF
jgi:hypothetical protein